MYNIGYLDDQDEEFDNYKADLHYHNIELFKIQNIKSKLELRNIILDNMFDCLIIDYNLSRFRNKEVKDGNELVRYLNLEIPDFPCIILTSYPQESKNEKTVVNSFILNRDVLTNDTDGKEYHEFVEKIVNGIDVFKQRLQLNKDEYEKLMKKKKDGSISSVEEDRLISLYKLLSSYNIVDEINPELLRRELNVKINDIISKLSDILGE